MQNACTRYALNVGILPDGSTVEFVPLAATVAPTCPECAAANILFGNTATAKHLVLPYATTLSRDAVTYKEMVDAVHKFDPLTQEKLKPFLEVGEKIEKASTVKRLVEWSRFLGLASPEVSVDALAAMETIHKYTLRSLFKNPALLILWVEDHSAVFESILRICHRIPEAFLVQPGLRRYNIRALRILGAPDYVQTYLRDMNDKWEQEHLKYLAAIKHLFALQGGNMESHLSYLNERDEESCVRIWCKRGIFKIASHRSGFVNVETGEFVLATSGLTSTVLPTCPICTDVHRVVAEGHILRWLAPIDDSLPVYTAEELKLPDATGFSSPVVGAYKLRMMLDIVGKLASVSTKTEFDRCANVRLGDMSLVVTTNNAQERTLHPIVRIIRNAFRALFHNPALPILWMETRDMVQAYILQEATYLPEGVVSSNFGVLYNVRYLAHLGMPAYIQLVLQQRNMAVTREGIATLTSLCNLMGSTPGANP